LYNFDSTHHYSGKGPSRVNYENSELLNGVGNPSTTGNANNILKEELRQQRITGKKSLLQGNLTTMHALSRAELDFIVEQSVGKFRPSTKHIDDALIESRSKDFLQGGKKKTYLACTENSAGKTLQGGLVQGIKQEVAQKLKLRPGSAPASL